MLTSGTITLAEWPTGGNVRLTEWPIGDSTPRHTTSSLHANMNFMFMLGKTTGHFGAKLFIISFVLIMFQLLS